MTILFDRNYRAKLNLTSLPAKLTKLSRGQISLIVVVIALGLRGLYAWWAVADFWGDAYHHWLISRLTLNHHWRYTDYKGLETVWLPGYHYLVSAVMVLAGRYDLGPAHLLNLGLGSAACGLTAWLSQTFSGKSLTGLLAGLALALTPWHIAYSLINMPEVLTGLLLLLLVLAAYREHSFGLGLLAFGGALTRHELTLAMVIIALWLVGRRRLRPALALATGVGLALSGWSWWSWHNSGDPWLWWSRYQALALWDAQFWRSNATIWADVAALWRSAVAAWPLLPWLGLVALVSLKRQRPSGITLLLLGLSGGHAFFLALGFVAGHLPVANPRYVLGILPLWVMLLVNSLTWRRELIAVLALVAGQALWNQLPELRDAPYIIAPERAAGHFLAQLDQPEANFWVDAPVIIYYSGLAPDRFFSSEQVAPPAGRSQVDLPDRVVSNLAERKISYILWEDVSYTLTGQVWPELAERRPFVANGYHFEPIFHYDGWETQYGARPTTIWQMSQVGP
jgi:hypothetical protein